MGKKSLSTEDVRGRKLLLFGLDTFWCCHFYFFRAFKIVCFKQWSAKFKQLGESYSTPTYFKIMLIK
jgi:hypothetical protein